MKNRAVERENHYRGGGATAVAQPDWLSLYLQEDLDEAGDITSESIFSADEHGAARLVAREDCLLVGLDVAGEICARLGVKTTQHMNDASWIKAGDVALVMEGPVAAILKAERLVLNVLGRMSGIATQTRALVETLADACCGATIAATRKTTPGFRHYEKLAVALAGGEPHRAGLYDAAMVKDNHREAAGGVAKAVQAVAQRHPSVIITAEVESLEDAMDAAAAGAHWLLIDNQSPEVGKQWADAVWAQHPAVKIEASGGITDQNVAAYGWADRISMGALTTAARSMDFSLEWGA